jgi:hypothetical protein
VSLARLHKNDFREMWIRQPRVRLDGIYISVCHCKLLFSPRLSSPLADFPHTPDLRSGENDNAWVDSTHLSEPTPSRSPFRLPLITPASLQSPITVSSVSSRTEPFSPSSRPSSQFSSCLFSLRSEHTLSFDLISLQSFRTRPPPYPFPPDEGPSHRFLVHRTSFRPFFYRSEGQALRT